MSSYVSPGVFVRERDLSAYVAALSSTAVGFVITSAKGPINKPTLITSAESFLDTFGRPTVNHFGPYAVLNYLRAGNQAWVNRVARVYEAGGAAVVSMGAADGDGKIRTIVVDAGHTLNVGDYIRVTQTGKRTSQNLLIESITPSSGDYSVEVSGGYFLEEYDDSSSSDSDVAVSSGGAGAAPAEVFAYGRKNGEVFPLVKFTARDPGAFANFGTNKGIEVVIEDGGAYQNVDPSSGQPIESDGIPLQGLNTSLPSVDTKIDLLKTLLAGTARVGDTRGVNYDSLVGMLASADSAAGSLILVIPLQPGWANGDVLVVTETTGYNGTYTVTAVNDTSTTTRLTVSGFSGALPGVKATATILSNNTNVANNTTVAVGVSGGLKTYTFKTSLTPTEGEVLIGGSADASLVNLARAINHTGTPGTDYQCAAAHTQVTANETITAHTLTLTSILQGVVGNTYTLAKSGDVTLTLSGALFTGGTAIATITGFVENTSSDSHKFGTVYRCVSGGSGNQWVAQGVLAKRVTIKYNGVPEEIFDNVIGYDPNSANFWATVIGTPTSPKSSLVTAEYLGSGGEQPMNSYNRLRHPYNPRYTMGLSVQVRVADASNAASETFEQALGYDGDSPTAGDYIGEITDDGRTGLQNFRNVEAYDISVLCTPGVYLPAVVDEMLSVVEERHDCLALVDPPLGLSVQEVVDWHNGTGPYTGLHSAFVSNKAALYYPWVHQFDSYSNRELVLPPSCFIPAVFASSDQVSEAWFAPAGVQRGKIIGAIKTERTLTQGDRDYMYGPGNGNGVNPIATFARDGIVVYGQRTLQRYASALDRVNVRRLIFIIEKSIATATRFLAFEQNDPILWDQFKNLVRPYLDSLIGRRGIEDYALVCDATTNTPLRRNNNEFYAKIAVVPIKSAEKILLDVAVLPSGINVTEGFIANDTGSAF